jgi:hypothetical protein
MQSKHEWLDDEAESATPMVTRRGVLAGSLKLAGAGALALTLVGGVGETRFALAQDATPPAGEAAGEIQVGTTDDTAVVEGEAAAGAELPADAAADEQTREERRAAREAEEAVGGGTTVGAVPSTGVGAALGSSLSGVMGAIGLATAAGAAALFTRRQASESEEAAE